MKKVLVIILISLLVLPMFSQYKGKSLGEVMRLMNLVLRSLSVKAVITKIVKNPQGKVDFYAQITTLRLKDENEFVVILGAVIAAVGGCTRTTSWVSSKLIFCHLSTGKPTFYFWTRDCRSILKRVEEGASDLELQNLIMKKLNHI